MKLIQGPAPRRPWPLLAVGCVIALAAACSSSGTTAPEASATTAAGPASTTVEAVVTGPDTTVDAVVPPTTEPATTVAPGPNGSVTLLTYDAFVAPEALQAFTAATGISVNVALAGDTGTMVNKALLTKGNPEGDVMWGIDNTLLSRAVDDGLFEPYQPADLAAVNPELTALVPGGEVTPVDTGDVCVNYDIAWFDDNGIAPPTDLAALTSPEYNKLLVVENPATSSPGLAFLMATVAAFPSGEWESYWTNLVANGALVVDSWDAAYFNEFTAGGGGGSRPLVVSYASSPPYPMLYGDPKPAAPPTANIDTTCFRQVEFAGVLAGTKHAPAARALVDFLITDQFQSELPESNFVYPARTGVALPQVFQQYGKPAPQPFTIAPDVIAAERDGWIEQWNLIAQA